MIHATFNVEARLRNRGVTTIELRSAPPKVRVIQGRGSGAGTTDLSDTRAMRRNRLLGAILFEVWRARFLILNRLRGGITVEIHLTLLAIRGRPLGWVIFEKWNSGVAERGSPFRVITFYARNARLQARRRLLAEQGFLATARASYGLKPPPRDDDVQPMIHAKKDTRKTPRGKTV